MPPDTPVSFPQIGNYLGYIIQEEDKTTPVYEYLQEFVSCIVNRDFSNPRLAHLSDLHPDHPFFLNVQDADVYINKVLSKMAGFWLFLKLLVSSGSFVILGVPRWKHSFIA